MKVALGIEYCGTSYCGWQRQDDPNSIQEYVENALSKIANQAIKVLCAGRTDAGVHALCQVVHFKTDVERTMYSWRVGTNALLPRGISILWAKEVSDDFHARFSATGRTYRYVIINRHSKSGVHQGMVTWERRLLDVGKMQLAANAFVGEHDFTSFKTVACQANNPVRNVKRLDIARVGDYVVLEIEANAFLHHMVRNIVGVLIAIGCGQAEISWADEVLAMRDRTKAAKTASGEGLYLTMVRYPRKYGIPMPVNPQWPPSF